MKKVMVFGTFDILHQGHYNFLQQARRQGEYLIVIVARDATVFKIKKRKTQNTEGVRVKNLRDSGLADKVVLGNLRNRYAGIKKYQPAVICLGYDQEFFVKALPDKLRALGLDKTRLIRLKSYHPEKYKTSLLKKHARH
jgi:FAD synthetase